MVTKEFFGKTSSGGDAYLYNIKSGNTELSLTDYGARIVSLKTADKNGNAVNTVWTLDSLADYETNKRFVGATIGRYANRIGKAEFTLNGKIYKLTVNNGVNQLHGGCGFDKKLWSAEIMGNSVKMSYFSVNGEEGYPGNLNAEVLFSLNESDELTIEYTAVCDEDTYVNMTNHSYFNLHGTGKAENTYIKINASYITETGEGLIPTGSLLLVNGSEYDFKTGRPLNSTSFDCNYVLDKTGFGLAAEAYSSVTGIKMACFTDQPGLQFFTGYENAFCLETQHFPDSPNQPHFPSVLLKKGETFRSVTKYVFSIC